MSHGRNPDVPWREQNISTIGYHYNMTPEIAENGLNKLTKAKEKNLETGSYQIGQI